MKTQAAFLALIFAVFTPAAENSPFYLPIRNNDLPALRTLIKDPGPKVRDARGNSPLMYAAALGSLESMGSAPESSSKRRRHVACGNARSHLSTIF
jgi:hypothetical protein